jgi:hypothetical protein
MKRLALGLKQSGHPANRPDIGELDILTAQVVQLKERDRAV